MPGIISSIFLMVVGAITRYAYSDSVWRWHSGGQAHSLQLDTVGLIFLWAGFISLILSVLFGFLKPRYYEDDYPGHHIHEDEEIDYSSDKDPIKIVKRRRRY